MENEYEKEADVKSTLITGGAGFIGANYVRRRLQSGDSKVVVLDALTYAGNGASLEGLDDERLTFVHGDIRDSDLVERLLREWECDCVIHFAAESHVDRSISGPDAFIQTNVNGTHALLLAAKRVWLAGEGRPHRFHHVSTDEVYGTLGPGDHPFRETNQYEPNSPYSASKAGSDHLVRAYHHTYGLEVTTTNCSNNYGPYQFPEKLIPLMIVNILLGRNLPVYGDGMQIRDWLYVDDHCAAIDLALERGVSGEVYNIGGDNERPNIEIVKRICEAVEVRFAKDGELKSRFPEGPISRGGAAEDLITYVEDRPGHDRRYAIDFSKAKRDLGYEPTWDFDQGLAATIDWYLQMEPWWRAVMDGTYRDWLELNYAGRSGRG